MQSLSSLNRFYYFFILIIGLTYAFFFLIADINGGFSKYWVDNIIVITVFVFVSVFLAILSLIPVFFGSLLSFSPRRSVSLSDIKQSKWFWGSIVLVTAPGLIVSFFVASVLFTHIFSSEVLSAFFLKQLDLELDIEVLRGRGSLDPLYVDLLERPRYQFVERFHIALANTPQYIVFLFYSVVVGVFVLPYFSGLFVPTLESKLQRAEMLKCCSRAGVYIDTFSVFTPQGKEVFISRFEGPVAYYRSFRDCIAASSINNIDSPADTHLIILLEADRARASKFSFRLRRVFR
jgi:hypothetical protein